MRFIIALVGLLALGSLTHNVDAKVYLEAAYVDGDGCMYVHKYHSFLWWDWESFEFIAC